LKNNRAVFSNKDKYINLPLEAIQKKTIVNARRVQSVDLLRGIVMVIMAIDHVRVYSGVLPGGQSAAVFFTRWITNFCAPAFAFFAGTSAFLYLLKSGDKRDVVRFLVTRGLILVALEMTVIRFFWTFNFDYANFVHTNVIWTLGWCMIILAAFVRLRPLTIGVTGLLIISFQQVFQFVPSLFPASIEESVANVWGFFYPSPALKPGNSIIPGFALPNIWGISILYVIIPWVGVMMAGYGFGTVLLREKEALRKICFRIGIGAIVLYLTIATAWILASPVAGSVPFIFKLLGQQKYPPSQFFLLMTLGPVIALVPWAERVKGWLADAIKIIGRVPMFYYLLHLLLIHLSAFLVNLVVYGLIHQEWYNTAPIVAMPEDHRWSLPLLYLVWFVDVIILYYACRWYARYKSNHPEQAWTKYL
jgi:uncharacterized membrane protein